MANFTFIFSQLDEVGVYSERQEGSFPTREGLTETIAAIQRLHLRGRGDAQGRLDDSDRERFSERNTPLVMDVPVGESHRWFDPAGGREFFEADYHASHFQITGSSIVELALRAQTEDRLELWVQTVAGEETPLRERATTDDRVDVNVDYDPMSGGNLRFTLKRRR